MTVASPPYQYIGKPVARREGRGKVTGSAKYIDDVAVPPGCLHGKTVRSTIPSGKITNIEFPPGIPWSEFTIVDARDVPTNEVFLIEHDQPVLCDGTVRHMEEPILLLAHPDRGLLEKAVKAVKITYETLPGIFEIGPGFIQKEYKIDHGDIEAGFRSSHRVFERTFSTGAQEHVYIETNGMIAEWDARGVTVRGSLQCPYYVHKAMKGCFGLQDDDINIIQETTGGGFGGKEEFPSLVAMHAALLAKNAGRPVKIIYDRNEDMACSTKRHPSETRMRVGVSSEGILQALDIDFRIDGGAYVTLSPVVLSRGILHSFGPYKWPAARLHARSYFTNSPPYGAFRGFGAPQSFFPMETMMSLIAEDMGIDPAEFRRRNFLHAGDSMPTGQVMAVDPNLDALMDRALEVSDYHRKRQQWPKGEGKGIGLSTFMHGAGFTGAGEVYLASRAALALLEDGRLEVRIANTEIGQGTETVFCQIVAEVMDIPPGDILFRQPETRWVPNSGPTVASRTCMVVGRLIEKCAKRLKEQIGASTPSEYAQANGQTVIIEEYLPPPGIVWDDKTYKGQAYGTYAWSCNVAEVEVDPVTMAPRVKCVTATVDIGTVVHPILAAGQVEGGIAQAVGWATSEVAVLKNGVMANAALTNYIIPTAVDAPEIKVEFLPNPYAFGAFGAKGVGELPMDGPAPAIAAAVAMAVGGEILSIPITPEVLLT